MVAVLLVLLGFVTVTLVVGTLQRGHARTTRQRQLDGRREVVAGSNVWNRARMAYFRLQEASFDEATAKLKKLANGGADPDNVLSDWMSTLRRRDECLAQLSSVDSSTLLDLNCTCENLDRRAQEFTGKAERYAEMAEATFNALCNFKFPSGEEAKDYYQIDEASKVFV